MKFSKIPKKINGIISGIHRDRQTKHLSFEIAELFFQHNGKTDFLRYDMIVRLLAVENFYGKNDVGFDFYYRMQKERVGKQRADKAVGVFKNLIKSYEQNGYDEKSEIELDSNLHLIDGSHRMAMAMYHQIPKISAKVRPFATNIFYGIEWFRVNGFSDEECDMLSRKYKELKAQYSTPFVCSLWAPVHEYFDEITDKLKMFGEVKEVRDYDFSDFDYAFYTRGIYHVDDIEKWKIEKKIEFMRLSSPDCRKIRMVTLLLDEPNFRLKAKTNTTLSQQCELIKKLIRDAYKDKVNHYFHDIVMHIGDNFYQNKHIFELFEVESFKNKLIGSVVREFSGTLFVPNNPFSVKNQENTDAQNRNIVWFVENENAILDTYKLIENIDHSNLTKQIVNNQDYVHVRYSLNEYVVLNFFCIRRVGRIAGFKNNTKPLLNRKELNFQLACKAFLQTKHVDMLLSEYRNICSREGIDITKTCVVGSSILALYGLRDNHDIDFVVSSDIRKRYGAKLVSFSEDIEMVAQGWARSNARSTISDDDLISNCNYHFIYKGIKFARIELVYERKLYQGRVKDIFDVWDIELLLNDN